LYLGTYKGKLAILNSETGEVSDDKPFLKCMCTVLMSIVRFSIVCKYLVVVFDNYTLVSGISELSYNINVEQNAYLYH
jgi:hypothetical protein